MPTLPRQGIKSILVLCCRLQPLHLGLEFQPKLHALILGQPQAHLWNDTAVKPSARRVPRQDVCSTNLGENAV